MTERLPTIGFIGLGVMGEPICRNLARKSGSAVIAFDREAARVARLARDGVRAAESAAELFGACDIVFLSLPSGAVVEELLLADAIVDRLRAGQVIIDLGTSPVDLSRSIARRCANKGADFADAPVARTRAAAEAGTLSVMVGASEKLFETIRPLIATFATEITLCGPVGCGQVVKILNNTVLFEIGVALGEARAIGMKAGVEAGLLFDTLAKGSADSFALRNHGMKSMVPENFPDDAFSVSYARKDLRYALELADFLGVEPKSAHYVDTLFEEAIAAGHGDRYWPVICKLLE